MLLEHQADVDAKTDKGWTALQIAAVAETQHEAVVRLLLEHKEDVDARVDDEWTALHWTVAAGHEMVVKLLLEKGAVLEPKDKI